MTEVRDISMKALAGDEDVTAEQIREKVHEMQQASLSLFGKAYEVRSRSCLLG